MIHYDEGRGRRRRLTKKLIIMMVMMIRWTGASGKDSLILPNGIHESICSRAMLQEKDQQTE